MKFIRVANKSDFDSRRMKSFRILGRPVGVFKAEDGSFHAMEAGCKHQHADLTTGEVRGHAVTCPRHQWRYDLRSGECLQGQPGTLRRHGLKLEGEDIYITLHPLEEQQERHEFNLDDEMDQERQQDISPAHGPLRQDHG